MRIYVTGSSGSGKSTLAARLAQILGAPHVEIDQIWRELGGLKLWSGPARRRSPEKIGELTRSIRERVLPYLDQPSWVIDGNYSIVRPFILGKADRVICLDAPYLRRLARVTLRVIRDPYGHKRGFTARDFQLYLWKFLCSAGKPPKSLIEAREKYP